MGEGVDGGSLDGKKGAQGTGASGSPQGGDEGFPSYKIAQPSAGHVERMGEGAKFHGDFPSSGDLKDARRTRALVGDLPQAAVVDQDEVMAATEGQRLAQGVQRTHRRRGVGGKLEDQRPYPGGDQGGHVVEKREKIVGRREDIGDRDAVHHRGKKGILGVAGIGNEEAVSGLKKGQRNREKAFQGAPDGEHFGVPVQRNAETTPVPFHKRFGQRGQDVRRAKGVLGMTSVDDGSQHMGGGKAIRPSPAEIDEIFPLVP